MTQRALIGRTITVLGLVALAWIIALFVIHTIEIFILLLISTIFASGLAPLVGLVERWHLPRGWQFSRGVAISLLYLALFVAVGGILTIILVPAVQEAAGFVQNLPAFLIRVGGWLADLQRAMPWLPDFSAMLDRLPQQIAGLTRYGSQAAGVAFQFLGGLTATIAVLVFTFYMLLEGARIKASFLSLFPPKEQPRVDRVLGRIGAKFGGWLRAQLLLSSTIAAIVAASLGALGMPFPLLLGIVAGIGELIPMVGPALGAAVAVLVALSQPLWRLVGVVIFYIIVMNVEPHVLVPRIMSRVVGMSPILTLVALLAGIKLLGILGGLIAVPVAAALQVIASEIAGEIQAASEIQAPGEIPVSGDRAE